jgi:hypothetical protein
MDFISKKAWPSRACFSAVLDKSDLRSNSPLKTLAGGNAGMKKIAGRLKPVLLFALLA